ncbi:MAG: UvrD-helicase domain-containing protein [Bacteroidales bacterium]|nr:UvrD-helicase domain-containing protein [Bacteroidales bacterium]
MIRILKASAGSGKTFRLAKNYLELLLSSQDRYAYRHILAVTFTNKATAEMKGRILKELHILATDPSKSNYISDFERLFGDREKIRTKAENMLTDILHDYSAFAVSTIDRFFQQALKAFAREIGQLGSYQVELDKDSLVRESVDRMLDAMTEDDKALLKWLTDSMSEQLEQGRRLRLEDDLYSTAIALKSDRHREVAEAAGLDESKVYSKENLDNVRNSCRAFISSFEDEVRSRARACLDVLSSAGVPPAESFRKFMLKLEEWADFEKGSSVVAPTDAWKSYARDNGKWFAAAKARQYLPLVAGRLDGPLEAFCDLFDKPFRTYRTARLLLGQLYSLGIAGELYREFDALLKEKNVLSLDDSNNTLRRIIAGSDAPFIYEKLGVRYEHFLLDEFQDTSVIQWENFAPLLSESDSSGRGNLVVGDIKQSIYRWRGSDWKLLAREIKRRFPLADDSMPMDQNWRSLRNIVEFNNKFFEWAASTLDAQIGNKIISDIYSDVSQKVMVRDKAPGLVEVAFCEDQKERIAALVGEAVGRGVRLSDIVVLVRNNAEGSLVASLLVGEGFPVVSDDSLHVKSSVTVRRLVSLLSLVDNPSDTAGGYLAKELGIEIPTGYISISGLCESLLSCLSAIYDLDGELLYIQSFLDEVQDWTSLYGNNLSGFLDWWEDQDTKISSPETSSAVRIMTIHKAKGLEFPYMIFPFAEKVGLFRPGFQWTCPDLSGTPLEGKAEGAYLVNLSGNSTTDTLFYEDYRNEMLLQYIDNINAFYVALTRAGKEMHIVAALPDEKLRNSSENEPVKYINLSQMLYNWLRWRGPGVGFVRDGEVFSWGVPYDFASMEPDVSEAVDLPSHFCSIPLGDRLALRYDSYDYFNSEGPSERLKGILLHDILSRTVLPSDLRDAVDATVASGDIDAATGEEYYAFLKERIEEKLPLGWFPSDRSKVLNERDIVSPDGSLHRPDRVILDSGRVIIIDFKTGEHRAAYQRQIDSYAALWREMGYTDVQTHLWYLFD